MTDSRAIARRAIACLDLTNLDEGCDAAAVDALCRRARTPAGPVAAVCLWPRFVARARAALAGSGIRVAPVVNFPSGEEPAEAVTARVSEALADGAEEIDLVIPWRALAAGDASRARDLVRAVKGLAGAAPVKAILETGELRDPALIARAGTAALEGGADFLKTSTGKVAVNATPEAAEILLGLIRDSGRPVGFKAAGGVRTLAEAALYLSLAERIMGPGWPEPARFRFGASGLLDALLAALGEGAVSGAPRDGNTGGEAPY